MNSIAELEQVIDQMRGEVDNIQSNRLDRNKKYNQCMNQFKKFLKDETKSFEQTQQQNNANKNMITSNFENTFSRVLASSDITIRSIKQTYNEKKLFWQNVIKINADFTNIELKKQFYQQKRNAEDNYYSAIDHQKDKSKPYNTLVSKNQKKQYLRDFQQSNKIFEDKVGQNSNTLQQWKNIENQFHTKGHNSSDGYHYTNDEKVINQFINYGKNDQKNHIYQKIPADMGYEGQKSSFFLNNFLRKR